MKGKVMFNKIVIFTAIVCFGFSALLLPYACSEEVNYRVYTEHGGMNVTELGHSEGHKSYHAVGGEIFKENMRAKMLFGMEGFIRGEAPDEDPEIPCIGGAAFVEYAYKWVPWASPYLGIRYDHISRGTAPKYDGPNSDFDQTTEHDMVSARGGFHFQKKWFYADLGTIIPFYTTTKSGNFGPDVGVGFKAGNWDIGYRYKEIRMTDNHFEGDTALSFYWSGVQLGYSF
jgi:hypothetical protein